MEHVIVCANYAFALAQDSSHPFKTRLQCALKGLILSLLGVRACFSRIARTSSMKAEVKKLCFFYLVLDTCFYWLHRLLHTGPFYAFHELHHRATHAKPADAIVASGLEIFLTGTIPFFGAVWLVKPHFQTFRCLLLAAMPFLLFAHSELDAAHQKHHFLKTVNFGNTRVWDLICGTNYKKKTCVCVDERAIQP